MGIRISVYTLAVLGWSLVPAWSQEPQAEYESRLTAVKGEVTVITAEAPEGVAGEADMPLAAEDKVKTGPDSSAELAFSGEHCVSLRSNSELAITSLKRDDAELNLALGSLLAMVRSLAGGSFRVRTPSAVAAVRGTEFGVEVEAGNPGQTHVGVFDEGKVAVSGQTGPPELLKSNQETSVRRGGQPLAAYQLRRFARHRQFMRTLRGRTAAMRRHWRALAPEQRQALRRRLLQKPHPSRHPEAPDVKQRRQPGAESRSRARKRDKEKLDKIKQAIRERNGRR